MNEVCDDPVEAETVTTWWFELGVLTLLVAMGLCMNRPAKKLNRDVGVQTPVIPTHNFGVQASLGQVDVIDNLTIEAIKDKLRDYDASLRGNKAELVARLVRLRAERD